MQQATAIHGTPRQNATIRNKTKQANTDTRQDNTPTHQYNTTIMTSEDKTKRDQAIAINDTTR